MKALRITAIILAIMSLLTVGTFAIEFVESIYRKDGPEIIDGGSDHDKLILSPIKELYRNPITIHEDIQKSLAEAEKQLGQSKDWQSLIADFAAKWEANTFGAPVENAVVSDIFDARYESELGVSGAGKNVEFRIKIQGITRSDYFMIVTKENSSDQWKVAEFWVDENDVITIKASTKSAFAVVRDNGAAPTVTPDAPDSPLTGVDAQTSHLPVIGALLGGAAVCLAAFAKRRKA